MGLFTYIEKKWADKKAKDERYQEFIALIRKTRNRDWLNDENINLFRSKQNEFLDNQKVQDEGVDSYKFAVRTAIHDGVVTNEEMDYLNILQSLLNIPNNVILEAKNEITKTNQLYEIANGNLPVVNISNLILHKGEIAHWVEAGNIIEEKVVSKHYVGGSHGVSFRIAKGVSYRVGASRGKLVSETAILPVSTGSFVLTNHRIIFQGDKKSLNLKYEKLLDLNMFADGIRITNDKGKPIMIQFNSSDNVEAIAAILSGIINS